MNVASIAAIVSLGICTGTALTLRILPWTEWPPRSARHSGKPQIPGRPTTEWAETETRCAQPVRAALRTARCLWWRPPRHLGPRTRQRNGLLRHDRCAAPSPERELGPAAPTCGDRRPRRLSLRRLAG